MKVIQKEISEYVEFFKWPGKEWTVVLDGNFDSTDLERIIWELERANFVLNRRAVYESNPEDR